MYDTPLISALLSAKGDTLRYVYALSKTEQFIQSVIKEAEFEQDWEQATLHLYQLHLQEEMEKVQSVSDTELHLQLLLKLGVLMDDPVPFLQTSEDLNRYSNGLTNQIIQQYDAMHVKTVKEFVTHQLWLFFQLVDEQYTIASEENQERFEEQLLKWYNQLPHELKLEIESANLTEVHTSSLFKIVSLHESLFSLLAIGTSLFTTNTYRQPYLVTMNAPLFIMASLEHEDVVGRMNVQMMLVAIIVTQLVLSYEIAERDELINDSFLLIKWSKICLTYDEAVKKVNETFKEYERIEHIQDETTMTMKDLREQERTCVKEIDRHKEQLRNRLSTMDLTQLQGGLVLKRMIEEHESLKSEVEELQRKIVVRDQRFAKMKTTFKNAERSIKWKVKEVERKKVLMQMTDFIVANRSPICMDLQREIGEYQQMLHRLRDDIHNQSQDEEAVKRQKKAWRERLENAEITVKTLEASYEGLEYVRVKQYV
ncbi:hypothetical protein [Bacillus sp. CGMCC 1.16541]|uniref:hypothetical protein n=1 Tax=Bacillus sp. CGMCC 1.16541 TaxID=2185143 RepID=UPI000D72D335|nr:hypothetical protein [Bacillus sp. CGMCC 1.16541]